MIIKISEFNYICFRLFFNLSILMEYLVSGWDFLNHLDILTYPWLSKYQSSTIYTVYVSDLLPVFHQFPPVGCPSVCWLRTAVPWLPPDRRAGHPLPGPDLSGSVILCPPVWVLLRLSIPEIKRNKNNDHSQSTVTLAYRKCQEGTFWFAINVIQLFDKCFKT